MDMNMKITSNRSGLSYYTTWWLTSVSSISSQNTALTDLDDEISCDKHRKKQNMNKNQFKSTCCLPIKIFRLK